MRIVIAQSPAEAGRPNMGVLVIGGAGAKRRPFTRMAVEDRTSDCYRGGVALEVMFERTGKHTQLAGFVTLGVGAARQFAAALARAADEAAGEGRRTWWGQ